MDTRPASYLDGPRHAPTRGVRIELGQPTIVFVTICTEKRQPWLTGPEVHSALVATWSAATAWLVGGYVLMPDHLHLFCAPRDLEMPLVNWVTYWKRQFTRRKVPGAGEWQRLFWDRRLRREESYAEKWAYVRENPLRAGLVKPGEAWPYEGVLNALRW